MAEHAVATTGHGHTGAASRLGHKHADQCKARCRLLELHVGRALRDREAHRRDQLAIIQRCGKHALEEVVGGNLALRRVHRGTECQQRARVAGRRVVVGHRATDGAHGTDLAVANAVGQRSQCRNGRLDLGVGGHIRMARHGADHDGIAILADAGEVADTAQIHDLFRAGKAQLHGSQQGLATGQYLAAGRSQLGRIGRGSGTFKGECIHGVSPSYFAAWMAAHTRLGEAGMSNSFTPRSLSASSTALITAGGEPMAPASPQPLVPRGLWVHGVTT